LANDGVIKIKRGYYMIFLSQESQKETESRSAEKNFEEFVDKMKKNMPDPIVKYLHFLFFIDSVYYNNEKHDNS